MIKVIKSKRYNRFMANELMQFEVPRAGVDFLEYELDGTNKLAVLKYLSLDKTIEQLGIQKFSKETVRNIAFEPVRECISEKWGDEFVYDLSKKNIPITFRASLSAALFSTKIIEYLDSLENVEIYASREIKQIYQKYDLPVPEGLTDIDYSSLPSDLKNELAISIVDNLQRAEAVVHAKLLFPEGVDIMAIFYSNPDLIFDLARHNNESGIMSFDKIENLDVQSTAAFACINDYVKIRLLQDIAENTDIEEKPVEDQKIEEPEPENIQQSPDFNYDKGTTLFDIFPFEDEENKEDLLKLFRIMYGTAYFGDADETDKCYLMLKDDGTLSFEYEFYDWGFPRDMPPIELNALTETVDYEKYGDYDEYRSNAVLNIISEIRHEMDTTKKAITEAKAKYGKTSFIVEKGFLDALTSRNNKAIEDAVDNLLAEDDKKTAGVSGKNPDDMQNNLVVYSDTPVDDRMVEIDYRILRVIEEQFSLNLSDVFSLTSKRSKDNIGDWFSSVDALISKFESVLVDSSEYFAVLEIDPTNNEKAVLKAYRKIAMETHEDKISHLPPEEQLAAKEKFRKSAEAYKNIIERINNKNLNTNSPTFYLGRISQLFKEENL